MSGTAAGGRKAAKKNLERDPDFYRKIGRKGGRNGCTGGFYANRELARIAGKKGGRISKRGPAKKNDDPIVPKVNLIASSDFIEHTIPKRRWPWSK